MLNKGKPLATIDDWSIIEDTLYGVCKQHPSRPELEGHRIRSSTVVAFNEENGYVETLNTVYRLGAKAEDRPYHGKADDLPAGPAL